ncbi:MAG: hypothetical protein SPG17_04645 [Schaalia hyovaginalis]|nr:hypothetical protein [Schaalia hyovaginalis]MDY5506125.1 hypothetical protein [Schaalia hyovaginalis]
MATRFPPQVNRGARFKTLSHLPLRFTLSPLPLPLPLPLLG